MLESEHILVLGWSNKLLRMLVELCSANAQRVSPLKPCSAQLSPMQRSCGSGRTWLKPHSALRVQSALLDTGLLLPQRDISTATQAALWHGMTK